MVEITGVSAADRAGGTMQLLPKKSEITGELITFLS
jgi:hypothetical protein